MSEERSDESVLKDLIQLTEKKVEETLKNADLTRTIREIIADLKEFGVDLADPSVNKDTRMRVYDTATRFKDPKFIHHRKFFTKYVAEGKTNPQHFQLYLNYFKKHSCSKEIDAADFEKTCGIGLTYSPEEIQSAVNDVLDAKKDKLEASKWAFGYGQALGEVKKKLTFADSAALVAALDAEIERRVGPKPTVEEIKTVAKQNAKAEKKTVSASSATKSDAAVTVAKDEDDTEYNTLRDNVQFHDPSENVQVRPELLEEHLRVTGGKVRTRFPPEPNGYLHIGHAKSMNLNFGYAKKKGGVCYMRFDDTNPQKEKQEYIDSILSSVEWLGHKPWKITYSSDYFPELFELAVKLIKVGKAFVCHQTAEEMQRDRWAKVDSPWRDRTVEENLRLFYDMKNGKFKEGEAVLRMRGDMKHDNPNMRDLVAYRIKYQPHPHVGDRWCIYPSYDFTHCIVDSLEHITHSLCTLEFENRKISYNWLLQSLDMYNPPQLEFSRLNLTGHAMSKRKLTTLVEEGYVNGWDDPRLPTINGFRRRGYTPQSINNFCERIGITRASNMISHSLLDECCRVDLDKKAPRVMAVLDPLKVTINGIEGVKELDVPDFPANPDSTTHKVPISNVIYIEREDFNEDSPKGYYRLTPTQSVGLKYFADGNIAVKEVKKDASGKVTELIAELVPKDKVKAHIQWVARPAADQEPFTIEARLYDKLFLVDDLSTVKNYLDALNPNSLNVVKAFVDPSLKVVKGDHVQFERLGFFYRDPDSSENTQIWNLTVTLKQDKTK